MKLLHFELRLYTTKSLKISLSFLLLTGIWPKSDLMTWYDSYSITSAMNSLYFGSKIDEFGLSQLNLGLYFVYKKHISTYNKKNNGKIIEK